MVPRRQRKKKRRSLRRLTLLVILLLVAGGCVYGFLFRAITPSREISLADQGKILDGGSAVNVLLMGIDHRTTDVGRSDTLVLLTVDMKKDKAAILLHPPGHPGKNCRQRLR